MKNYLKALLFFFVASVTLVSCSDDDDPKVAANEFTLDGTTTVITAIPFWKAGNPAHGTVDHIRLVQPIAGSSNTDLFKITPVSGTSPLEGTYTYNKSGDVGTYNLTLTHDWDGGFGYLYTTNGDSGQILEIELVTDNGGAGDIYDITISSFNLNYGNWDFSATSPWITEGNKTLVFHYRGVITPA